MVFFFTHQSFFVYPSFHTSHPRISLSYYLPPLYSPIFIYWYIYFNLTIYPSLFSSSPSIYPFLPFFPSIPPTHPGFCLFIISPSLSIPLISFPSPNPIMHLSVFLLFRLIIYAYIFIFLTSTSPISIYIPSVLPSNSPKHLSIFSTLLPGYPYIDPSLDQVTVHVNEQIFLTATLREGKRASCWILPGRRDADERRAGTGAGEPGVIFADILPACLLGWAM